MISSRFAGFRAGISAMFQIRSLVFCAAAGALLVIPAAAQVITLDSQGRPVNSGDAGSTVDRRFAQVQPTNVKLSERPLDAHTRADLIRSMEAEQGFAMRPIPMGHRGLTLEANGKLQPAGEAYLNMVTANGICAKPGDRVVITDLQFDKNKLIFVLNGGPDAKHRFLRHISIGAGASDATTPVVQDNGETPQGARITLAFKEHIPAMTAPEVKALLAPLITFDAKTPLEAFTDTLPPDLKKAILEHHVLVGMSTDMLLYTMGHPDRKMREMEGQMPIEIWIYGKPPEPVQFVRINGNRVIRYEIAKVGEEPQVFDKDVVSAMMRTDGTPAIAPESNTRVIAMGDAQRNANLQAPAPPPTLRGSGESLPQDTDKDSPGAMRPVQFPKQKPDDYPDATNLPRTPAQPDQAQQGAPKSASTQTASNSQPGATPASPPAKDKPAKTDDTSKPASTPQPAPGSTQPD